LFESSYLKHPEKSPLPNLFSPDNGVFLTISYDITNLSRELHDVIVVPGGTARTQQNDLGETGINQIKEFVSSGGGYLGICAGGFLGSWNESKQVGLKLLPDITFTLPSNCGNVKGNILLKNHITDELPMFHCPYHNGPLFPMEQFKNRKDVHVICSVINGVQGFEKSMDGLATIIRGFHEKGHVILVGPHPEQKKETQPFVMQLLYSCKPQ